MKPTANPEELIKYIAQPAFLVKDGIIQDANKAALNQNIVNGTNVADLITIGFDAYQNFSSGKLYLELKSGRAWVSVCSDYHLFTMESGYSSPELRTLALAAQHLREPLSNAVSGMELLLHNDKLQDDDSKKQLGQINRSLYQMIRSLCNMSDVSQLGENSHAHLELQNATAVFREIFEKVDDLTKETGHTMSYRIPSKAIDCMLDAQLLERAILNLISNAIKFSPVNSTIKVALNQKDQRLTLTVENDLEDDSSIYGNAFNRFLREPGIESGNIGIGIGMSIISQAVSAHSGTVLLDANRHKDHVKIMLSIPIRTAGIPAVKSPITIVGGYTGGINNYLVELSDVLPEHYYESN